MHKYGLLSCVFLISCTVGPDYENKPIYSDETVKKELKLSQSGKPDYSWQTLLNDEQFRQLLTQGLENSTDVKTAISKLRQARATRAINKTTFLPQTGLQGGYQYEKGSDNIKTGIDSHYYSAGFDASWELDIWGQGRRQTEADTATVKAAEYSTDDIKISLAAEIASDYVYWLQSKKNLQFAEQNVRLQQDILSTVKAKYQNGLSDEASYEEARFLLENTQAQIPQYRAAVEQYLNALATVMGVLPSQLNLQQTPTEILFKANKSAKELTELPASVVRLRPDVAAAEQRLIAQNALVGAAVADLYPSVSLSGLWGYAAQGGRKLFNSESQTYNYAPSLTLPLLDWNKIQNNIKLQEYIKEETFEQYKQTVINAITEIKNAQVTYRENEIGADNKYRAWQNMRTAADLTAKKYKNGLAEFSDVMRTQQNLLSAQQDYVEARSAQIQSLIAYYKAIGVPVTK